MSSETWSQQQTSPQSSHGSVLFSSTPHRHLLAASSSFKPSLADGLPFSEPRSTYSGLEALSHPKNLSEPWNSRAHVRLGLDWLDQFQVIGRWLRRQWETKSLLAGWAQWWIIVVDPLGGLVCCLSDTTVCWFQQENMDEKEGAPGVREGFNSRCGVH